uniref:Nucleoprotein n=1 Tax=Wood duck chaphamaparvovirus TaxID=2759604 RepID=A0A7D6WSJ9_9VIRU|nr:nucleoprotein [Wood duck chaphamaparvovirus]
MAFLFLESLAAAANAAIANSVGAGRLLLAAQQLEQCRQNTNPWRQSWLPGMPAQNLQWAADPCQKEKEAMENLIDQGQPEGNQVATQQIGGAPAPQLADTMMDPVGNTDPAIPANEYVTPLPGAQNPWSPVLPEDAIEAILMEWEDQDPPEDMLLDELLDGMRYYLLWCPWGGPGTRNAKWRFAYKPVNSPWINKWSP